MVTWHDYIWWVVMVKHDINAHNIWHSELNPIKVIFLDSSHQNLSNDICLLGSTEVRIFPLFLIVFANYFIMMSFIGTLFSNLYIL